MELQQCFAGYNSNVNGTNGDHEFTEGHWTFDSIANELKTIGGTLKGNKANGKCSILYNDGLFLENL